MKIALLSTVALLLVGTAALAETKVTVGVGHMCCGNCKASATKGVTAVAWVDKCDIDMDNVTKLAIDRVEQSGIVFLDEIDKIAGKESSHGPDVSREGVGFDSERNAVAIITHHEVIEVPETTKWEVAQRVLDQIVHMRQQRSAPVKK